MDMDDGGKIEKGEFVEWMNDVVKDTDINLENTFNELDLNNDGKIDL